MILDAAEALFAEKGYNGAGLREITAAAGVRLGLANYHFENKAELYRRVLARRAPEFAAVLTAALDAALAKGADASRILEAYARPHLEKLADPEPGWRNYLRLVAQSMLLSRHDELFYDAAQIYLPAMRRYRLALAASLPERADLDHGFHLFRMAVLSLTAFEVRSFEDELASPTRERLCTSLVGIFFAGLTRPPLLWRLQALPTEEEPVRPGDERQHLA